jgi:hypothetical protein
MVCPNCHSDKVIAVQDQHFCINCGQMVPEAAANSAGPASVAVQENGLPEGVKILPVVPGMAPDIKASGKATPTAPTPDTPAPLKDAAPEILVKPRSRMGALKSAAAKAAKPKNRKPGRPKAGRLDAPKAIAASAPASTPAPLPTAPKISAAAPPPSATAARRRLSDIAPRQPATPTPQAPPPKPSKPVKSARPAKTVAVPKKPPLQRHSVHKVGVPPLHYGAVLAFSLRAHLRPRLILLASVASLSFAAAGAYGAWLILHGGIVRLADQLMHAGLQTGLEVGILALLYYIGRNLGQAAITYGVVREADQRPVPFSRQLGVAINTFGRRLALDLGFMTGEVALLALIAVLVLTGGDSWPVDPQIQVAALFASFLVLLYLLTALAITRGLAAVALVLTPQKPWNATKLGWSLFSHRFELLGMRFFAIAMELVLAIPLAALAVAFIMAAPAGWQLAVVGGVAVVAWLAGALIGAGTATWWAALYRRLILVDRADAPVSLLSSRQPQDANRGALSLIVSLTTILVAAALTLPWLKLP